VSLARADVALPPDLVEWMETVGGGRVIRAVRRPGGARKEAWFIDVERGDATTAELFLRYDRTDPAVKVDPWTLHREATVYLALQDTDVPVPRVLGVHPVHQAMLSERIVAENWFSRIGDADERVRTAQDFMVALVALHRLDPAMLTLPGFPPPTRVPDLVHHEIDEWQQILDGRGGDPDPALTFAMGWLRRHVPDYDGPVVLVQGDTGPGNFMYRHGRVLALVDWELAHLGDPMDDIAWLTLRCTQEPFPDLPARLREYEALSGRAIDEGRARYYRVMAETKLQVMNHRPGGFRDRYGETEGGGADLGNGLIYGMLHRRLWLEAMADALGVASSDIVVAPEADETEYSVLSGIVLDQLRDVVVPRISDPLAQQRTKGLARVIKYLAALHADGPVYQRDETDDLTALIGERPGSVAAGRRALADLVRAGGVSDQEYLAYLWRRVARENELMRPASGALADRHWPPLR
jgi:aminoglycoside phosphotransferase (APT) family kinase protein